VGLALVFVLVAELAVRIAAPHLPPLLEWDNWQTQLKVDAMDKLAARGGASIVSIGASDVDSGIDPRALAGLVPGDPRPTFNAALDGSNIHLTELWTLDVVLPRLHPKVVVLGMNAGEVNENGLGLFYSLFVSSLGWREASGQGSAFQKVKDAAQHNIYLARYRTMLRKPTTMFRTDGAYKRARITPWGDSPTLLRYMKAPYRNDPSFIVNAKKILNDYQVGPDQMAALGRLVRALTARGIRVVLVRMPVSSDEISYLPHGAADYAAFMRVFEPFVESNPVIYVDGMADLPGTTYLRDSHHVNLAGRARLTALVAHAIAAG
jgi:hypothetical protein